MCWSGYSGVRSCGTGVALRQSMGCGVSKWRPWFTSPFSLSLSSNSESLEEEDGKAGPFCSPLLLSSGCMKKASRKDPKGWSPGDADGAVAFESRAPDDLLWFLQVSKIILTGPGKSRTTRIWERSLCYHLLWGCKVWLGEYLRETMPAQRPRQKNEEQCLQLFPIPASVNEGLFVVSVAGALAKSQKKINGEM